MTETHIILKTHAGTGAPLPFPTYWGDNSPATFESHINQAAHFEHYKEAVEAINSIEGYEQGGVFTILPIFIK